MDVIEQLTFGQILLFLVLVAISVLILIYKIRRNRKKRKRAIEIKELERQIESIVSELNNANIEADVIKKELKEYKGNLFYKKMKDWYLKYYKIEFTLRDAKRKLHRNNEIYRRYSSEIDFFLDFSADLNFILIKGDGFYEDEKNIGYSPINEEMHVENDSEDYIVVIENAIENNSLIKFNYFGSNQSGHKKSIRTIKPEYISYKIYTTDYASYTIYYATGFCHLANEERTFNLDRISNLIVNVKKEENEYIHFIDDEERDNIPF